MPSSSAPVLVLDSWPLVEWLKGHEPARGTMAHLLADATRGLFSLFISKINLGEVIYIARKDIGLSELDLDSILDTLLQVPITVFSASDDRVDAAVDLKSRYPFAYADAFAAALAMELYAPLVTGDKEFRRLEGDGLLKLYWVGA